MSPLGNITESSIYTISKIHSPCKRCLVRPICTIYCYRIRTYRKKIFDSISALYYTWFYLLLINFFLSFYVDFEGSRHMVQTFRKVNISLDVFIIAYYINYFIIWWYNKKEEKKKYQERYRKL